MHFTTAAHQTYFERVQAQAMEITGGLGKHPEQPSLLVTFGSVQLHVDVEPWGPLDAKVRIVTVAGRLPAGASEEAVAAAKTLLELNGKTSFASFALDAWGNVTVSAEFLGSSCSRDVLLAGLTAVGHAKEAFDEAIGGHVEASPPAELEPAVIGEPPPPELMHRIGLDMFEITYCIRGLPISVHEVVAAFAAGRTEHEILTKYPDLEPEDLDAARRFAAHFPEKVERGFEPKPEPPAAPSPPAPVPRRVAPPLASRIAPDDMGLYYSIRGLPIAVREVRAKIDEGLDDEAILAVYPDLEPADLDAVRAFDGPPL